MAAEVTDSGGGTGSASIGVTVGSPPSGDASDIYVWDINFSEKHYGRGGSSTDLMTTVTIRRDSDADGMVEDTDELVPHVQARYSV